jgi:hypothetical protein
MFTPTFIRPEEALAFGSILESNRQKGTSAQLIRDFMPIRLLHYHFDITPNQKSRPFCSGTLSLLMQICVQEIRKTHIIAGLLELPQPGREESSFLSCPMGSGLARGGLYYRTCVPACVSYVFVLFRGGGVERRKT